MPLLNYTCHVADEMHHTAHNTSVIWEKLHFIVKLKKCEVFVFSKTLFGQDFIKTVVFDTFLLVFLVFLVHLNDLKFRSFSFRDSFLVF